MKKRKSGEGGDREQDKQIAKQLYSDEAPSTSFTGFVLCVECNGAKAEREKKKIPIQFSVLHLMDLLHVHCISAFLYFSLSLSLFL